MDNESKKDLVIGMLFGLATTFDCAFTNRQQDIYDQAKNIINEIYYSKAEADLEIDIDNVKSYQQADFTYMKNNEAFIRTANQKYQTDDVLCKSLHELSWDTNAPYQRIINCLRTENIYLVGEVLQKTMRDLSRIPNFGMKSLNYLVGMFNELGLSIPTGGYPAHILSNYKGENDK